MLCHTLTILAGYVLNCPPGPQDCRSSLQLVYWWARKRDVACNINLGLLKLEICGGGLQDLEAACHPNYSPFLDDLMPSRS